MIQALLDSPPRDLADANGAVGRAAAGPGDVPVDAIRARHFGGGKNGRKFKARFLSAVAARLTRDDSGRPRLPRDVVVDRGPNAGQTIADLVQHARPTPLPDEAKHATQAVRRREFLNRTIQDDYLRFCEEHRPSRTGPASVTRYNRERGPWLNDLFSREGMRVGTGRNALIEKANRIVKGEITDGRCRSGRRRGVLFAPEIFEQCQALHTTSGMDLTGAHSVFAWGQAEAAKTGRVWMGSQQRFRELIAENVTRPERVMGREGDWAHEGRCLPKMKRPRGRVPCGKGGSLDGTPDDVFCQGIGRDGRPRPIRLQVVGLSYYDSGKVVLETGRSESADTTMRLLRRVYADDILDEFDTDWGSGFTSAGGKRRGVLADPLMENVQRPTERYGTRVDQKPVRKAWLKPVESFWAQKKRIDREHEFYIGEAEEEKKIAWKHALANAHRLLRPDERAAEIQRLSELHNNTERPVLGGLTPNAYHEQHRGEIRRPDPEELDMLCSVFIGTRKVKPNGVHLDHLDYGGLQDEVYALQGRKVFVWKPTEEKPPFLWLCDADGRPLAIATCSGLECATLEDVARTQARVKRLQRLTREVVEQRRFLIKGRRAQVTQTLHEYRMAQADARQRAESSADNPPVQIVAAGLGDAVRKAKAAVRRGETRRALQAGVGAGSEAGSEPIKTGLELLSARARERPEPEAETECLADRLRRFAHAG